MATSLTKFPQLVAEIKFQRYKFVLAGCTSNINMRFVYVNMVDINESYLMVQH